MGSQGRVSKTEYNQLSVRLELQADFLAGVFFAGVVGGLPVTVTTEQVLAFSAGEGITPTEAATLIVAAELQRFVA